MRKSDGNATMQIVVFLAASNIIHVTLAAIGAMGDSVKPHLVECLPGYQPRSMADPHAVTRLLRQWAEGDPEARNKLIPLVYTELRQIAAGYLRAERPDQSLQPTVLVTSGPKRAGSSPYSLAETTFQF
jgi:hypothetical protein